MCDFVCDLKDICQADILPYVVFSTATLYVVDIRSTYLLTHGDGILVHVCTIHVPGEATQKPGTAKYEQGTMPSGWHIELRSSRQRLPNNGLVHMTPKTTAVVNTRRRNITLPTLSALVKKKKKKIPKVRDALSRVVHGSLI